MTTGSEDNYWRANNPEGKKEIAHTVTYADDTESHFVGTTCGTMTFSNEETGIEKEVKEVAAQMGTVTIKARLKWSLWSIIKMRIAGVFSKPNKITIDEMIERDKRSKLCG